MAERLKAHAWKACIGETLSRVRIPLSPPRSKLKTEPAVAQIVPLKRDLYIKQRPRCRFAKPDCKDTKGHPARQILLSGYLVRLGIPPDSGQLAGEPVALNLAFPLTRTYLNAFMMAMTYVGLVLGQGSHSSVGRLGGTLA
jgi:hypothetical protein